MLSIREWWGEGRLSQIFDSGCLEVLLKGQAEEQGDREHSRDLSTMAENTAGTVGTCLRFLSASFQHLSRENLVLIYSGLGNKCGQLLRRERDAVCRLGISSHAATKKVPSRATPSRSHGAAAAPGEEESQQRPSGA